MLATSRCAALVGVEAIPVHVEADVSRKGLPGIHIVGLIETAVRESLVRIRSALRNCGYSLPPGRITVSLAPADLPKSGSGFDLAIALALLAGSEIIPPKILSEYLIVGELSLKGELRPVRGALSYALCERKGETPGRLILPASTASQALSVPGIDVIAAPDLPSIVAFLRGDGERPPFQKQKTPAPPPNSGDLKDVHGQEQAKRALEICAAGGHNLLFLGPPGTGKSMLASRLPSILPKLTLDESIETSAIWSIAGLLESGSALIEQRPLRSPHHSASDAGIVGGGVPPRPGELSLAHNGVLFLDELPEFKRSVLEALRQPLEQGSVVISRATHRVTFPARIQLVGAMNPCPCGMYGEREDACVCRSDQIRRYRGKVSAPLLDRIDLHVEVPSISLEELRNAPARESSEVVRDRVVEARKIQQQRYQNSNSTWNAILTSKDLKEFCSIDRESTAFLNRASEKYHFSVRAFDRVRKVARTIADLEGQEALTFSHIAEALSYRVLDRGRVGNEFIG